MTLKLQFKADSVGTGINLLLAVLACTVMCTVTFAAGKRPVDAWSYYHFDGVGFKVGPSQDGSPFIAVRERFRPVVLLNRPPELEAAALPRDAGVIAGVCYVQSSGGKLGDNKSGYVPCVRAELLVSSGGKPVVTLQTDELGYFVTVLPAGKYLISRGAFTDEILVHSGSTTLVPLRSGKRMVD